MKRIASSLAIIAVVALFATVATRSLFSDTASLKGITFSTGNASLQLSQVCQHQWFSGNVTLNQFNYNGTLYAGCQFNFDTSSWYPGKTQTNALYLGNFSTADIALSPTLQLKDIDQSTPGLDNQLMMQVWWYGSATGTGMHPLSYYANNPVTLPTIQQNGHLGLNVVIEMNPSAGNQYANQNISFNFYFDATQAVTP